MSPTLGPCPVCGERERVRQLEAYRNETRTVMPDRALVLAGCERCGLAYTVPRPTEEQLEVYYGTPDGWEARKARVERPEDQQRAKLERSLENKRARRAAEFDLLCRQLPRLDRAGVALDFGCGLGGYLDVLQQRGWETWGIEPGPRQRAVAAERHRMVEEPLAEETFDLVILNHVLEHLRDPLAVLRSLAAATKPDGLIFVSVPDLERLGEHGRLRYVRGERHICSWTAPGLSAALGLAGFAAFARLDWDGLAAEESWRLKLVGEKTGAGPVEPAGSPLDPAVAAVEEYAANARRFEHEHRERRRQKQKARRPRVLEAIRRLGR